MPFAWAGLASSVIGAGTAAYGASQAGSQGAAAADPFGSQRPMYQNMLSNLMANPSSVTSLPGYQFQFDQGMQALERGQAASGTLGGGTASTEDIKFGQGLASTSFGNWEAILQQLAGGNLGTSNAGSLTSSGVSGMYGAIGQGIGAIGGALGKMGTGGTPTYDQAPVIDSSNFALPVQQ